MLVLAGVPATALADSDGYYCKGPNYLAYQFGLDSPTNPVRLFVVRLGTVVPLTLQLEPFQVHGMRCETRAVQLLGFTHLYTVELDDAERPIRFEKSAQAFESLGIVPNLGTGSPSIGSVKLERVALGTDRRGYSYTLEMDPRVVDNCRMDVTSRVVERNPKGQETRAYVIFHEEVSRECGGVKTHVDRCDPRA